jgi:hypothetical protein
MRDKFILAKRHSGPLQQWEKDWIIEIIGDILESQAGHFVISVESAPGYWFREEEDEKNHG